MRSLKKYGVVILFWFLSSLPVFSQGAHTLPEFKGHKRGIRAVAYSPDGKYIATAGLDKRVRIWRATDGHYQKTLGEHTSDVLCLAFSPDGKYLASGSADETLILREVRTWKKLKTCREHSGAVTAVAFSRDSKWFATASADNTVKLWKIGKWRSTATLLGHRGVVNDVCFSPDGKTLATASADKTVRLWNMYSFANYRTFDGHKQSVTTVRFHPNEKHLISAGLDNKLIVWGLKTARPERINEHDFGVLTMDISPDGSCIATGTANRKVWLWNFETGENFLAYPNLHKKAITALQFSPDGRFVLTGSLDENIKLWKYLPDTPPKKRPNFLNSQTYVMIVGVSQYQNPKLNLKYAASDAWRIYSFYKSPEGGALPDNQLKILVNQKATKQNIIRQSIDLFAKADTNDIVIFYFTGHGLKDSFLPHNYYDDASKLKYEIVLRFLANCKAQSKFCIADACHSGAIESIWRDYKTQATKSRYAKFENTAFLLSSKAEEKTIEYKNIAQGHFTFFLLTGLKGNANSDLDKTVTIKELEDFIMEYVPLRTGGKQNPVFFGDYPPDMPMNIVLPRQADK